MGYTHSWKTVKEAVDAALRAFQRDKPQYRIVGRNILRLRTKPGYTFQEVTESSPSLRRDSRFVMYVSRWDAEQAGVVTPHGNRQPREQGR